MKSFISLVILFCSLSAQAGNHVCGPKHTNLKDLSDVHKQLFGVDLNFGWFSVSKSDVMAAPCKSQKPPTEQEMLDYLQSLEKGTRTNAVVEGVAFQNEDPALLKLFRDMHGPNQKVSPSCTQVLCAMQELYGKKEGIQLLYMMSKYGFNGSYKMMSTAVPWKAEELDDVLMMFADWPSSFLPIQYGKPFLRMKKYSGGSILNGKLTIANASVAVFGVWGGYSSPVRQAILYHEMGHNIAKFGEEL